MSSKVKDGLFLGDIDAAQDAEFLQLNGIVHIINCVPRQVPNLFQQSLGLAYVACDLEEVLRRPFFDLKNRQFMGIVQLIDRALEQTESVLVHSLNGLNRSPSVMMGYLMVKYCWGVDKAYEFLLSKRSDIKPHESYIDQLCLLEAQLQTQFGSRATEQQLYEWHPTLADPCTDEIVLIHTYLNALSASKPPTKKEPNKPPASRRLSWIDQSPQMKKLYPSLMIKPERPPNHSYSDMVPANGWVDLINPANAAAGPVPKPIAAFLDSSTSSTSSHALGANDQADVDDDEGSVVNRGRRVHSFSVPQRRDIEVEPSSPASERDEQDLNIDVAVSSSGSGGSSSAFLPRQPVSRHQQQLRSVVTSSGPVRQSQQQQQQLGPAAQTGRSTLTRPMTSGPSVSKSQLSSYTSGGVTSTTMSSTSKGSTAKKIPDYAKPVKPGSRNVATSRTFSTTPPSLAPARQPLDRRSSSSSSGSTGSFSARGSYTGDLPLPQTQSAFSMRRAVAETDSWATAANATFTRPRTAPPRMRKKDSESTLFQSKTKQTVDTSFLTASSISGGISRVSLDVASLPSGVGHRLSGADYGTASSTFNVASFRTQKLSGRNGSTASTPAAATPSATASTAASRSKSARAHWK